MRHLALDVGDERIGVALSDETGLLARPYLIVPRVSGRASFDRLLGVISEFDVRTIVVGLPLLGDGQCGKQVRSVQAYVAGLERYTDLPIVYWDERHSTQEAAALRRQSRGRALRAGEHIDDVAAAVILQDYLDHGEQQRG